MYIKLTLETQDVNVGPVSSGTSNNIVFWNCGEKPPSLPKQSPKEMLV